MHPHVRAWLVSLRPWSFPASLGPVALAGAVLHRPPSAPLSDPGVPLLTLPYVLCFVVVLAFHAAANLFNTYYDFRSGADRVGDADDRGLVDGTVAPTTVLRSACALLALGVATASYLAAHIGPALLGVAIPAAALCFFYTADPFSLKRYALGDATIFLMFGPLLMSGVNLAVAGNNYAAAGGTSPRDLFNGLRPEVLCYSVPIGLLTVAILHANNARDIEADGKAGISTLAMSLGRVRSYYFHCAIFLAAYGSVAYFVFFGIPFAPEPSLASAATAQAPGSSTGSPSPSSEMTLTLGGDVLPALIVRVLSAAQTTPRQLLVFLCAPWALYVTRLFAAGVESKESAEMSKLPQRIAQHNLVFCTLLVMGLSEPMFLARVLIGCLFYLGGVNNVIMWSYNVHLVHMKLSNVFGGPGIVPQAVSRIAFAVAAAYQLACSLCFMLGFHPVLMAQLLLLWIVPVTFTVHDMWTIEHDNVAHIMSTVPPSGNAATGSKGNGASKRAQASPFPAFADRHVAIFPTEFDNEFVHFFKNVQIIGGLVLYVQVFAL